MSATRAAARKSGANNGIGLADAIRARVAEDDQTLEGASVSLGLKPNTLWRWTQGIEPTALFYAPLMAYLGITLEELGALIVRDQLTRAGLPRP